MIAKRCQKKQSHPAFFFFTKKASSWLAFRTSASMLEMELMDGIEPSTSPLPRVCSTPELHEPKSLQHQMERVVGIEPTPSAWKAEVLPLNYTRLPALTPACRDRPAKLLHRNWWRGKDSNLRSFRGRFTVCSLWPLGNLSMPATDFTLPLIDVKRLFLLR